MIDVGGILVGLVLLGFGSIVVIAIVLLALAYGGTKPAFIVSKDGTVKEVKVKIRKGEALIIRGVFSIFNPEKIPIDNTLIYNDKLFFIEAPNGELIQTQVAIDDEAIRLNPVFNPFVNKAYLDRLKSNAERTTNLMQNPMFVFGIPVFIGIFFLAAMWIVLNSATGPLVENTKALTTAVNALNSNVQVIAQAQQQTQNNNNNQNTGGSSPFNNRAPPPA